MDRLRSRLPLSTKLFHRPFEGAPHEEFALARSGKGRIACLKLALKKAFLFPFEAPFFVVSDLILLVLKVGNVAKFSVLPGHKDKIGRAVWMAADYAALLPLIPLVELAELIKYIAGALFTPSLHYKLPNRLPEQKQREFYKKKAIAQLELLLKKEGLAKGHKRELWNIKKKIGENERSDAMFFLACCKGIAVLACKVNDRRIDQLSRFVENQTA